MLISNPFADPLFLPTLRIAGGVLSSALLAILLAVQFNAQRLRRSVLFERWKVWGIITPIYGLAVLGGDLSLLLLLSLLVLQALREYVRLAGLPRSYEAILLGLGLLSAPAAMLSLELFYALPPMLLLFGTLQPLALHRQPGSIRHLAFAVLGWAYIAWFLTHLVLIYKYIPGGPGILLAIGLATGLSDVGAFTLGKLFGRRRLAPTLSPNKTWEGLYGNFLGAYIGVWLMAFALPEELRLVLLLVLPVVVALGSVWGDLLESGIKREFGAKDAGGWLPGFGGLLDRIDSTLIVAPLASYSLWAIIWFLSV